MSEDNKKVTKKQKQAMVDFMQQNYMSVMGKFGSLEGKMNKEDKWKEMMNLLNGMVGPTKDILKWKRCWFDMKSEVKKKIMRQRQNRNQTGAAPINITFSDVEEKIVSIVGKEFMDGDASISEIGFDDGRSKNANKIFGVD